MSDDNDTDPTVERELKQARQALDDAPRRKTPASRMPR